MYDIFWVKRCRGPARLQNCKSSGEDRWNETLLSHVVFQLVSKSAAKKSHRQSGKKIKVQLANFAKLVLVDQLKPQTTC